MLGEDEARQYLLSCQERGLSDKSVRDYATELQRVLNWAWEHHLDPTKLSRTEIGQLIRRKGIHGETPKPNTVNTRLYTIRGFYRWLWEEGHNEENVTTKIRQVHVPRAHPNPISHEDFGKLWAVANGERTKAALVLTRYCGLRGDEVRNLQTSQIGRHAIQQLKRKGGETVMLPWRKMILSIARGLPTALPMPYGDVVEAIAAVRKFPTVWPSGFGREWLRDQYRDLAVRAGVPHINPHRGRATATSDLLRAGVPLQHVKFLLDIRKWETLIHYVKTGRTEFYEWYERTYGDEEEETGWD